MSLAAHRETNSDFKVVAITSVYGTTDVDNVVNNVTRTLNTVKEKTVMKTIKISELINCTILI